jgi:hypothetical protein
MAGLSDDSICGRPAMTLAGDRRERGLVFAAGLLRAADRGFRVRRLQDDICG